MPASMTALQFITSPIYGCCTTGELMALSRQNKQDYEDLKKYAVEEMKNRGIELTVQS